VQDTPDRDRQSGRHEVIGALAKASAMPAVPPDSLWRSPNLFPVTGRRYTVGWQDSKKAGPCFLVVRTSVFGEKILDRFPLTQDGWSRAWAALVELDTGAAQAVAKILQERQRREAEERQRRLQLVRHSLDRECSDLLRRAEAAEESILVFYARGENLLDAPVDVELLRDNVLEVLNAGAKISNLRAQQRAIAEKSLTCGVCGGRGKVVEETSSIVGTTKMPRVCSACGGRGRSDDMPSSMTAAVLEPQKKALAMVLRSVTSRVENLEHYASSVTTVDRTYRDWIGAQEAERLNDPVRDVLAETLRDELAVEELRRLTDRANIAKEAFRRSIYEANLAGETLALPAG
jgi:hypothetical protein